MKQAIISVSLSIMTVIILAFLGYYNDSPDKRYFILAIAIAVLGIGLSYGIFVLAQNTDNKINELNATLSRIEDLQQQMHEEQKELAKSNSPMVTSLQALSQYYMDYLANQAQQKSGEEQ